MVVDNCFVVMSNFWISVINNVCIEILMIMSVVGCICFFVWNINSIIIVIVLFNIVNSGSKCIVKWLKNVIKIIVFKLVLFVILIILGEVIGFFNIFCNIKLFIFSVVFVKIVSVMWGKCNIFKVNWSILLFGFIKYINMCCNGIKFELIIIFIIEMMVKKINVKMRW